MMASWVVRGAGVKERADMRTLMTRLLRDDEGQDLVEYVLLVSLIALAVAAAFPPVTNAITAVFNRVESTVGAAVAARRSAAASWRGVRCPRGCGGSRVTTADRTSSSTPCSLPSSAWLRSRRGPAFAMRSA